MSIGTIITVAPTGAETAKADAPALPVTLDELVTAARGCQDAGAAIVHVHVRDAAGASTMELGALREAVAALRESTDLVVQLSTGGAVHDTEADRLRALDADPDMASLTCGTLNFGGDVFLNRWPFVEQLYLEMRDRRIVPELECFDLGHIAAAQRLLDRHGPPWGGHVHVDLVCGVPGGMPGTPTTVAQAAALLPQGATFSATGVGRSAIPVMLATVAQGGHLRVGMEDTLTYAAGQPVRDNVQLVERAAALAALAQRPPLDPASTRDLLGVPARASASAT